MNTITSSIIGPATTPPFDFALRNAQGQSVLFTRLLEQSIVLELHNHSSATLTIPATASQAPPTEQDCTFQLRFRSDTLWEPDKVKLGDDSDSQEWKLSPPSISTQNNNSYISFYLSRKTEVMLTPQGSKKLMLNHIAVDGRGGSRGTRVEVTYQNLKFAGNDAPPRGTQMQYLAIMDESPTDEPGNAPILIDWNGPNTFLNDGVEMQRKLRLYNNSGHDLLLKNLEAKITIDAPVGTSSTGWALVESQANLHVELEDWEHAASQSWPIVLIPKRDLIFGKDRSYDVTIRVQTRLPSGPSWITVKYEGFEHLESARRVPALKTKLLVDDSAIVYGGNSINTGKAVMSGTINDYMKAQFFMSGGGKVTWAASRLKWTNRFIAIGWGGDPNMASTKYVDIFYPNDNSAFENNQDRFDRESGIRLADWEALYAIHEVGGNNLSVRFAIYRYSTRFVAPSNWLLVAGVNSDDGTLKLGTGAILSANSAANKGSSLPSGTVVMWYGDATRIPDGWAICDGTNNTPNLIGRFVMGAKPGSTDAPGTSGPADTHTHAIPPTNGTTNAVSDHTHASNNQGWYCRFVDIKNIDSNHKSSESEFWPSYTMMDIGGSQNNPRYAITGPGGKHDHTVSIPQHATSGPVAGQNRPAWFALCYIMKL